MPEKNGNGQSIKIPMILIITLFLGALGGVWGIGYAEDKENDEKIAELQKKSALHDQTQQLLINQLEQLNDNLKQQKAEAKQDATNAMLRELLKQKGKDPDKVIKKAKDDKKKKKDEKDKDDNK